MSRFESKLLASIEQGGDHLEGRLAGLAWAAYRARIGDIESAKRVVAKERARDSKISEAQLFAYINYVEGLCEYFDRGIETALKKFLRASALAAGCPRNDCLPSLIFGWLAALYRSQGRWKMMVDNLLAAVEQSWKCTSEVKFRVCLVCADIQQEVGEYAAASAWYDAARGHALEIGDDAAISAMLYNRAAIRIFNARLDEVAGQSVTVADSYIALQASSAHNYTQYIRDQSMRWGFDLMEGQLHLLRGDFDGALALFESSKFDLLAADWPNVDCVRQADMFRCRAQIGQVSGFFDEHGIEALIGRIERLPAPGDRAIAIYSILTGVRLLRMGSLARLEELLRRQIDMLFDDRRGELEEYSRFSRKFGDPSMLSDDSH